MAELPQIRLDHVNLPARRPEWLANWYAEKFGFTSKDGFVSGPGTLLVFETGEPLENRGNAHFGFRCQSCHQVVDWATCFRANLEQDSTYYGFKTEDQEGNVFEVYWEGK